MMRQHDLTREERDCLLYGTDAMPGLTDAGAQHGADRFSATVPPPAETVLQMHTVFKEQARQFAEHLAQRLSERLHTSVDGKVLRVAEATYGDCVAAMESPTCLQVIEIPPCETRLLLELHSGFVFPLLNRLLGGGTAPPPRVRRGLTEIETQLVRKLSDMWLSSLAAACRPSCDTPPRLERFESYPQRAQAGKPATPMWMADLEMACDDFRGTMQLAMPASMLRLFADCWYQQREATEPYVDVVATLGQPALDAAQARELKVGDLVLCQASCDTLVRVFVDGKPTFWAKPGTYQQGPAVQLQSRINV